MNALNWEMERFRETIFKKFPTITKLSDSDYENRKCKIFEKEYNELSNNFPIDYKSKSEYKYIDSWLYPEKYFEVYAKLLQVDIEILKTIGELCDPIDMEKENLKIPVENLEIF